MHMLFQVDFPSLLAEVESACRTWRKPTLLLFGQNDPFINIKSTFAFLDAMRTNFQLSQLSTRVSHAHIVADTSLKPLQWGCGVQCFACSFACRCGQYLLDECI